MRLRFRHLLAVLLLAACLCSCGREGKVIPRNKMARIYAEMFLADAWLLTAPPDAGNKADTMAFYEPIFEEYGYTIEDYWASVSHYLLDPDRFSRIVKRSNAMLTAELKSIQKALEEEEASRPAPRKGSLTDKVFDLYGYDFKEAVVTSRVNIQLDSNGRYVPVRIIEDTMYFGPRMIIAADSLKAVRDTLDAATDSLKVPSGSILEKPLPRPSELKHIRP